MLCLLMSLIVIGHLLDDDRVSVIRTLGSNREERLMKRLAVSCKAGNGKITYLASPYPLGDRIEMMFDTHLFLDVDGAEIFTERRLAGEQC